MDQAPQTIIPARSVRILHSALLLGLVGSGTMLALLRRFGQAISLPQARLIGIAVGCLAIVLLAIARLALRPRIPAQGSDQTAHAYWSDATVRLAAITLWAMVEGAGFLSAMGYYLTGSALPLIALALVLGVLISVRPARLESDGAA
jgi:hypothetical protein